MLGTTHNFVNLLRNSIFSSMIIINMIYKSFLSYLSTMIVTIYYEPKMYFLKVRG